MKLRKKENYNQTGKSTLVCPICGGTEIIMNEISDTASGGRTFLIEMSFYCFNGHSFKYELKSHGKRGESVIITDSIKDYYKLEDERVFTATQIECISELIDRKLNKL